MAVSAQPLSSGREILRAFPSVAVAPERFAPVS